MTIEEMTEILAAADRCAMAQDAGIEMETTADFAMVCEAILAEEALLASGGEARP